MPEPRARGGETGGLLPSQPMPAVWEEGDTGGLWPPRLCPLSGRKAEGEGEIPQAWPSPLCGWTVRPALARWFCTPSRVLRSPWEVRGPPADAGVGWWWGSGCIRPSAAPSAGLVFHYLTSHISRSLRGVWISATQEINIFAWQSRSGQSLCRAA